MGVRESIQGVIARFASLGLSASVTDVARAVAEETKIVDEKWVNFTAVTVINSLHKEAVMRVRKKDRAVFLPHCLRNAEECKAKIDEEGYHCARCGKCSLARLVEECEKNGVKWFIVGGGSAIFEIMKKHGPKAVIGVSCFPEAKLAIERLSEFKIPLQSVLLSKAGCVDTRVDLEEAFEKIRLPEAGAGGE
ncbi:MAG: DUF116 domain-containing protein [Candidatus Micrarchaeota archaeon]|nr:DUF116 domain-containing protein [Candidatus Micrarchaeota archaeon]